MKIAKRQLRRIIREEKQRVINEKLAGHQHQRLLEDISIMFEKEINTRLSQVDGDWYRDPETVQAVSDMLDMLKRQMKSYGKERSWWRER
ncbi:MAG: hypothetical protein CMA72_06770 [Euryarchaeota archaeon]|nr:hypothetical protein [Euryarchaeota archaeon]|tara:strand:+ start:12788 stop:13057 length:270 start_codon:yes stop_codon:yes gene_type:complete